MLRLRVLVIFVLIVLAVVGCRNAAPTLAREGTEVAPALVRDVAGSIGASSRVIRVTEGEVQTLARRVHVQPDRVRIAMAAADQQSVWQRSLRTVGSVDDQTKGVVRSVMFDTACDVLEGEVVTYQDFFFRLGDNAVSSLAPSTQQQLGSATQSLIYDLQEAAESDDDIRAAVAILCYTADAVTG